MQSPSQPTPTSDFWQLLPYRILGVAVFIFFAWVVWAVIRQLRSSRDNTWVQELIDAESARIKEQGLHLGPPVQFTFYTYEGVIAYFVQKTFTLTLPAEVATAVVRGMHKRNLRKCLTPHPGTLYVPFISKRELTKQEERIREQASAAQML